MGCRLRSFLRACLSRGRCRYPLTLRSRGWVSRSAAAIQRCRCMELVHLLTLSVLSAIMLGFALYYIRSFVQILGETGQVPVALAAWAPPVASLLLAMGLLLHMEDG